MLTGHRNARLPQLSFPRFRREPARARARIPRAAGEGRWGRGVGEEVLVSVTTDNFIRRLIMEMETVSIGIT